MAFRTLLFGLVAVAAVALTGCTTGSGGTSTTGSSSSTTEGDKFVVGVSIPDGTHGWANGVVWWAEEMQKKHSDVEFIISTAQDASEQVNQLATMQTQGIDALVILPMESAPLTPAVKKIHDAGIYVVSVDRGLTEQVADVYLRGDNAKFGQVAAEYMAEKLGGKGNILIIEGMQVSINKERVDGFNSVISKYPDIKVLASRPGNWNTDTAYNVTRSLLTAHSQVDAIWASDDDMALGAERAIKEANRPNIWMVGGGGSKVVVKKVMDKDPMYPATVTYSPRMIVDGIERAIEDLKAGKKAGSTQEDVILPVDVINPDNAPDFYFPDSPY